MGYRLQLSAEIHDWLTELRDSDPPTAVLAAQAPADLVELHRRSAAAVAAEIRQRSR